MTFYGEYMGRYNPSCKYDCDRVKEDEEMSYALGCPQCQTKFYFNEKLSEEKEQKQEESCSHKVTCENCVHFDPHDWAVNNSDVRYNCELHNRYTYSGAIPCKYFCSPYLNISGTNDVNDVNRKSRQMKKDDIKTINYHVSGTDGINQEFCLKISKEGLWITLSICQEPSSGHFISRSEALRIAKKILERAEAERSAEYEAIQDIQQDQEDSP